MTSPIETNNVVELTLCGVEQPKRIWLMVYRHAGDVCWTSDPNPDDADEIETVEYVRADQAQSLSDRIDVLEEVVNAFLWWADQQCPCQDEQPNPCTLCGASVENLEPCKARELKFPRTILAKAQASLTQGGNT